MNNLENEQYIKQLYEEFNTVRNGLMTELKNDLECVKEKVINQKINCIDNLMKFLIKFRNINIKENLKGNL
jgi:molecular chaperone GrpE (heat shock protein)